MKMTDNDERAIHLAKGRIKTLRYELPELREKYEKQIEIVETRKRSLSMAESKLQELQADVTKRDHDSTRLEVLINELGRSREEFAWLSDEEFEKRKSDLRWEIGDYVGKYTFVTDPFAEGGF